jgi:hypothetical protein
MKGQALPRADLPAPRQADLPAAYRQEQSPPPVDSRATQVRSPVHLSIRRALLRRRARLVSVTAAYL